MTLALSLAVGVIFGAGIRLVLARDLVRIACGTIVISNAAILFLMSARLARGREPILPEAASGSTDPLVQALVLTAIVISFGSTALLMAIVHRVWRTWGTLDVSELGERREDVPEEHEGRR